MSDYPHLLEPLDLGFTYAAQPGRHGLDAHGPRGPRPRLRQAGRLLRRAGPRRSRRSSSPAGSRPNVDGSLYPVASKLIDAARGAPAPAGDGCRARGGGGKIALQILHAGRYAYHPWCVAPSAVKSPDLAFTPAGADATAGCAAQIAAFARCARLAREAGYDGVEVMGSEGYLVNQFLAPRTNRRTDAWGGTPEKRRRFAVETVRAVREATGPDFILIYRISVLDLVEDGQTWDEVTALAREVEAAGASMLNLGIGWHEARVPTIVTSVPRGGLHVVRRAAQGARVGPGRGDEPDQHARGRRGRARRGRRRPRLAGAAVPRRPRLGAQGRRVARRRDQHVHRVQPGLPRPHLRQPGAPPAWSTRAPCHETELVLGADAHGASTVAVVGAGPAGLAPRPRPWPSAGHDGRALRGRRPRRRPVRDRACGSRARRSSPRRSATTRGGSTSRASRCTSAGALEADELVAAASTRSSSPPASSRAMPDHPGHRPPDGHDVCRAGPRRADRRGERSRSSAPAASASTSASS